MNYNLIYTTRLSLWRDDYKQRFENYLLERGVCLEAIAVAHTVLDNISSGKQYIVFGITALKEIVISVSDVLHIKVVISKQYVELYSHRDNDFLISCIQTSDFNADVFNLDLVQAYKYAGNKILI